MRVVRAPPRRDQVNVTVREALPHVVIVPGTWCASAMWAGYVINR